MQTLTADAQVENLVSTEYLDTKRRVYGETYANEQARHLRSKYAGYKPAAIYVTDDNALLFARDHLSRVFPGVAVFFSGVNDYGVRSSLDPTLFTGVFERKEVGPNIEWLLLVDKNANDLIFIGDGSNTYQAIENELRNELSSYPLRVTFIAEKRLTRVLERLHDLPGKYIFLTTLGGMTDENGQVLPLRDIMKSLASTGRIVISMEDAYIIEGVLGGSVTSGQKQGMSAARLLLAYLHGKPIVDLPPIMKSPNALIFDDRELQQHGIDLPENLRSQAVLLHPRLGFYEQYRSLILGMVIGLPALLLLVVTASLVIVSRKSRELSLARNSAESTNALFNRLAEQGRTVHWEVNAEGLYTYVSPVSYAVLGYRPEELVGKKHFYDLLLAEGRDTNKTATFEFFAQKRPFHNLEIIGRTRDGRLIWVITNGIPRLNDHGTFLGYRGFYTDINERKQTEEALRKSMEEAKRLAQENALVAEMGRIIGSTLNIEDVFEHFSEAVAKLIPFDRIQINLGSLPEDDSFVRYVAGTDVPDRRAGEYVPLTGTATVECFRTKSSLLLQPKDAKEVEELGARFPRLLPNLEAGMRSAILVPLIAEDTTIGVLSLRTTKTKAYTDQDVRLVESIASQIAGAVANAQLFAERKQAEEEKRSFAERLQRAEKMEALGQLAGGVAHDLNNVLGIVVGYAELVLMDADESSSIRPHLVNIMKGGQRAAAIVDDLLTLARRGVSGRSILNLNKIITECQQSPEFVKLSFHHPSAKIKTDLDPDLLNISGSRVHLGKTLFNLVSNACEAMAKGGIVTIRTANQYLDKPIHGYDNIRSGDYAVLSVSDTGEGISANDLKRIFEPFYTKKIMGRSGTGLGLAVVWGTVKDHSGYIDVWSEEGKGSIFTLYFPVTREEISAEAVAIAISEYMGKGESILVVDDAKEQRDLASGMLRTLNYNVSSVSSGEEAVPYLKEHKVDLMVLDMIMDPGMDGLDTYRSIVAIHPQQRAIIVSGFSESDRVHAAQSLGAGAYVRKPYIKEKLGLAVRKELDRK